ncbi:hypothetical protein HGRIS_011856 [Hohenbuehelia grisea]|uniref:Uncharacterized protein n=1 Tax=Hohenbuehelia grisea TaxID=104357 RepID=A0ABR3JWJ3_9AGAR
MNPPSGIPWGSSSSSSSSHPSDESMRFWPCEDLEINVDMVDDPSLASVWQNDIPPPPPPPPNSNIMSVDVDGTTDAIPITSAASKGK